MLDEAQDPRVIERQMETVKAVHQVVHIIWLMAQAQLTVVEETAAETSHYLDWVDDTVSRLTGEVQPPSILGNVLHIVFGPERGYCGSLARDILAQLPEDGLLGFVGANLTEQARRHPEIEARVVFKLAGATNVAEHEGVAHAVAEEVLRHGNGPHGAGLPGGVSAVMIHYPPGAGSRLKAAVLLGGERTRVGMPPETLSPLEEVLDAAVIELVTGRLAVAAIEALRSEVRARVAAADRARQGCDRRHDQLMTSWRVARQAQITTELLEIVAGHLAAS